MLRWLEFNDAPFIIELLNDPSFIRNIGQRNVTDIASAQGYINKISTGSYKKLGFGSFHVALKNTLEPIGLCSLIKRDYLDDVDIGFAYLPKYFGCGYATEAAQAVSDYCRDVLKFKRIVGFTSPTNQASVRVLQKIGLKFERDITPPDETEPLQLLALDY